MEIVLVLAVAAAFGMALRRVERGLPLVGPPRKVDVAALVLFTAFLGVAVYGIENTDRVNSGTWQWVETMLTLAGYLGCGVLIGRWWATLVLPMLAILIALPAGENPAIGGDIPWVAFIYVFLAPLFVGVVGVGVVARKFAERLKYGRREPKAA